MIKLILLITLSSICIMLLPISSMADYPADCETHIVKPTTNNPKILNFTIPQADLQGQPPQTGSFVTAYVAIQNAPSQHPKMVRSDMIMDNYWGAQGAAPNYSTDYLGNSVEFWFYEDHIQTKNNAYLHFVLTKIGDEKALNPVVIVKVCTFKH